MPAILEQVLDKRLAALIELAPQAQAFLAGHGVAEAAASRLLLALEEGVRNVIEHASPSLTDQVRVRLEVAEGSAALVLEDDGPPFDPRQSAPFDASRPLAERTPNGMGVHLLLQLMDEVHYERLDTVNRLRLVVALAPEPLPGAPR